MLLGVRIMKTLLLFMCATSICSAQPDGLARRSLLRNDPTTDSNVGMRFALGFLGNIRISNPRRRPRPNANFYIGTNNPGGAEVTISLPHMPGIAGFPRTVSITSGRTEKVIFPSDLDGDDIRVNSNEDALNGILVESTADVNIIGVNGETVSTDGFLALPCQDFRPADRSSNLVVYKYFVFSTSSDTTSIPFQSRILIVPCEEVSDGDIDIFLPSGESITLPLIQYGTFMFEQIEDLTGTVITSRSPLSVFVGHECGQVPSTVTACDHLVEQVPPHAIFGTMFFAVPFALRESGDLFRIGSVTDGNEVTVTCTRRTAGGSTSTVTSTATIDEGQFHSHRTLSRGDVPGLTTADYRRDFCCIETSKPAIVMQYSLGHTEDLVSIEGITGCIGDPAMSLVPPVEQYGDDYIINSFDDILDISSTRQEFSAYLSWAVATEFFNPDIVGDDSNFMVNNSSYPPPSRAMGGSGEYVPIRCSNGNVCGYGAFGPLPTGDSTISYKSARDPNAAVYASIYGFGIENSYAYPAGYQSEPIGLPHISVYDVIVNEQAGSITIPFNRTGGDLSFATRITASTVEVADGMAVAGSDFIPVTGIIRWRPDAVDPRVPFTITILDDDIEEPAEYFEVHFTVEATGFVFPVAIARVTIVAFQPQIVSISPVERGVLTAGDEYTLQCSSSRVATLPNSTLLEAMWLDPGNNIITSGTASIISGMSNTTATTLTITLTFPRLTTSQGGQYSCVVNMTVPDKVTDHQVISTAAVRMAVATSARTLVTFQPRREGTLYIGTSVTLMCTVTVTVDRMLVDTDITVTFTYDNLPSDASRIITSITALNSSTFQGMVDFRFLLPSDVGVVYSCESTVQPVVYGVPVANPIATHMLQGVEATVPPDISVTLSSVSTTAGDNFTINCTATVIEDLTVPVSLQWLNPCSIISSNTTENPHSSETERIGAVYNTSVSFTPIHTSHGGRYSCVASINVPGLSPVQSVESTDVTVQIPTPDLTLSLDGQAGTEGSAITGTVVSLQGSVTLADVVDTQVTVLGAWSDGSNSVMTFTRSTSPPYATNLTFNPLSIGGVYFFTVTISPSNPTYIRPSSGSANYTLSLEPYPDLDLVISVSSGICEGENTTTLTGSVSLLPNTAARRTIRYSWTDPDGEPVTTIIGDPLRRRTLVVTNLRDTIDVNLTACLTIPGTGVMGLCGTTQYFISTNDGGHNCSCNEGYVFMTDSRSCEDIDECSEGNSSHNCEHFCNNTVGGFMCYCDEGYELINGNMCEDINECSVDNPTHDCGQMCNNTIGGFNCFCEEGFVLADDNKSCVEKTSPSNIVEVAIGVTFALLAIITVAVIVLSLACYKRRKWRLSRYQNDAGLKKDFSIRNLTVQSTLKRNIPKSLIIPSCNLQLEKSVGQGEFGIVYKARQKRSYLDASSETVAVKTLKGFVEKSLIEDLLKECAKMQMFDHPNVLKLSGVCLDGGPSPYIVMPFMVNGSLHTYLREERENIVLDPVSVHPDDVNVVQKKLMNICIQIAKGMEYLSSKRVIHRDLSARNCMIDVNFVIKVADFGLSETLDVTKDYFRQDQDAHIKLPLKWMAPESITDGVFSEKSDTWAYGVTLWEIYSGGKTPYPGIQMAELSHKLEDGYRMEKPQNAACTEDVYSIMMQCWVAGPDLRPSFTELVKTFSSQLMVMAEYTACMH